MWARLNRIALLAAQRSDIVIACFMLMAVVMMILPLPTVVVDVLIGVNISLSTLILIVAFYVSRPAEFSVLPPVILLSTLFRLALSITTTRLILRDGDAGEIIATFGDFVIGGEIVVGLVIFLIITVAQFLVITKGAERVAEVAARFSLDSMPGKQMSIDNDLRNGDINQGEARTRRAMLERESQLFGAMDGAMKFVKGDAIASLIILVVNLLGGLLIGMAKHDMSFAQAGRTYSLLSVGDGLVAQIPSLLTALAAGIVVTRVASGENQDLGNEIMGQLGSSARALWLTCGVLVGLALVPGFPTLTFLILALVLGACAYTQGRRRALALAADEPAQALEPEASTTAMPLADDAQWTELRSGPDGPCRVTVRLGARLAQGLSLPLLTRCSDEMRGRVGRDLGLDAPVLLWLCDDKLDGEQFRVDLDGVPLRDGQSPARHARLMDGEMELLAVPELAAQSATPMLRNIATRWIPREQMPTAAAAGLTLQTQEEALAAYAESTIRRHADEFLGLQETRELLSRVEVPYPELAREAQRLVPLQRMAAILRRLLDEGIALTHPRTILEALVEWGGREAKPHVLSEHVRSALARQICHAYADAERLIPAYVLARPLEQAIRQALKQDEGRTNELPEALLRHLVSEMRAHYDGLDDTLAPVVVTAADIRRYIRQLLVRHQLDLPVLAFSDVQRGYTLAPLASIDSPPALIAPLPERAAA
jgi:type III secretion protein V